MLSSTVLIVDDDEHIVDLLEFALQMQGYRVLASVNGAALELARDMHPDLILLDINMPGMNGIEISQRLRADPATADIPLIAMSAVDALRSLSSEMLVDDRLPKPFELAHLYELVARWVQPH